MSSRCAHDPPHTIHEMKSFDVAGASRRLVIRHQVAPAPRLLVVLGAGDEEATLPPIALQHSHFTPTHQVFELGFALPLNVA